MSENKEQTDNLEVDDILDAEDVAGEAHEPESVDRGDEAVFEAEPVEDGPSEEPSGPDRAKLEAALQAAIAERDAMKDQALRFRAELDNYRKRTAREIERIRKTAAEGVVRDLLPVLDNLELAMQHADEPTGGLAEGVSMVARQFTEALGRHGVEPIQALGGPFDPNLHEAVMQREEPGAPEHTVVEEFQKGYILGGQVLRPSKVVVSTGGPECSADDSSTENEANGEMDSEAPEATS